MENQKSFEAPEASLHFLDYWRIIRIRKAVILAVFLLVALSATIITFLLPPQYTSTVRIRVEKDAPDINGVTPNYQAQGFDPYWIQTEFEVLKSKSILYQVITNRSLDKRWAKRLNSETALPLDYAYLMLKKQLDIEQYRNTSIIEVKVEDEEAKDAAEIANEVATVYKNTRLRSMSEMSERGLAQLQTEHDKIDSQIKVLQAEIERLKVELRIPDSDDRVFLGNAVPEPEILRKLENMRVEAMAEYQQALTLYGNLTNLTRAEFKTAVLTASPDSHLQSLLERQADAEQKLADLIETFSPEHPDVIRVKGVLGRINDQVNERLEGILEGLKVKVTSAKARLDSIVSEADKARANDIETAIRRAPYFSKKRDVERMKEFRERLANKITGEKVDSKVGRDKIVDVIDPAQPALRPSRPDKFLNISLGVVLGLILGVGLAFFIEYLDTSVKTIDDVERTLQAPVLGVIPQNVGSLLDEGLDSPHAEAYRVLRTNILFSRKDPKHSTVSVLSGGAGEGKSTTLFNLAVIFAQNDARVLVVDSDLRRPSVHKILRVSNSIGLTNYLLKQNTLEEVIQTTPEKNLDFLPSGKLPSSSMGIMSSLQMKELIRELKRRYDFVFFDAPPIMGVSDASILASEVDMVVQVIQYRRYPQPMTIRAKQLIEKVGGNLLGIVLNNINMSSDENYYYYSGYYYDYYSKSEDSDAKGGSGKPEGKSGGKSAGDAPQSEDGEVKSKY